MRVVFWCVGILLTLLALGLGVALNSSFQTWAARQALAARSDVQGTIGALSAGPGRIEVRNATLRSRGAVLTLPALHAELPLIPAGFLHRIAVHRLVAHGWTLDLSRATNLAGAAAAWRQASPPAPRRGELSLVSSARAADPAAVVTQTFHGVIAAVQLPFDLAVTRVDLAGEVILPGWGDEGPARLQVTLTGGDLTVGRTGRFVLNASGAKSSGETITLQATIDAAMDTPRTFARLATNADAAASGVQFPQGVRLNANLAAERTETGETYSAVLAAADKQLAMVKGELLSAAGRIAGEWKIDLHDSDLSPFLFGRKLPVFAARGDGAFETGATLQEIHVNGQFNASAEHLETLRAELTAIGGVNVTAQFDLWHHGNSVRVERLDAALSGAAPVATVRALQPFEFNLRTAELRVADPAQDLVGVALTGVPLAWAGPWLGDFTLTGGDMHGDFAAGARDGGLALRARTPLTISGLSLARAGRPLLREVDLALNASADYTPRGWQAEVVELGVRHQSVLLLRLDARAGQLTGADRAIKATGHWQANLPGWAGQPVLSGQLQLATGQAQGEFTASLDGTQAFQTKMTLTDLVAATQEQLPAVTAEVRADLTPAGTATFTVPIALERSGRQSDLLLAGTAKPSNRATHVDARLTSTIIYAEDARLLALLVPSGDAAPATDGEPPGPFWSRWTGQIALALKKVVTAGTFEITNVGGTLRLDPTALNLEGVQAAFGADSDLKLSGAVKYDEKAKDAYAVGLVVALNNFDTGPAFRAVDPTKLPTVEGRVNLTSRVAGSGENLAQAAERARGDLQVTGRSGVFRALSADVTDRVQRTQSTVAAIGGLLGAVTGKKEYVDYAEKTQILTDIAKALAEIPFDQLNVTATRDSALNLALKDFTLISPEIRLTGGGGIQYEDSKSLLQQPLNLELQLGARGQLGELLERAGLLESKQDNLGYTAFLTPIRVTGTLAKTDTGELLRTLLNSALLK